MVMRETLDEFQGGLQIEGQIVMSLRYTDDIILLAILEAELQELVDRLETKSAINTAYSVNINKTNGERRHSVPHTHSE